ncbi:MAG: hypothetical protein JSW73_00195 [Candidatus Woesearchaeota archaeon]|nr:MAG: hypothetical protein JSW73_00195 [Candidatus Woesearchaeota archaeon]
MKKTSLMLSLLIVISTLAGAIAFAEEEGAIDASELLESEITEEEVNNAVQELKIKNKNKKFGFATVFRAHGWIENEEVIVNEEDTDEEGIPISGGCGSVENSLRDECCENEGYDYWTDTGCAYAGEGYMINAFWLTAGEYKDAIGRLYIEGKGYYILKEINIAKTSTEEETYDMAFNVIRITDTRYAVGVEEIIGSLILNKVNEYEKLTTWSGELSLHYGQPSTNMEKWDVELGTNKRTMRTGTIVAEQAEKIPKRVSGSQPESVQYKYKETKTVEQHEETGKVTPPPTPLWRKVFFFWK